MKKDGEKESVCAFRKSNLIKKMKREKQNKYKRRRWREGERECFGVCALKT